MKGKLFSSIDLNWFLSFKMFNLWIYRYLHTKRMSDFIYIHIYHTFLTEKTKIVKFNDIYIYCSLLLHIYQLFPSTPPIPALTHETCRTVTDIHLPSSYSSSLLIYPAPPTVHNFTNFWGIFTQIFNFKMISLSKHLPQIRKK